MKRTINEFLSRVNQTYVQNSQTLRYGQVLMNELFIYDEIAYNVHKEKAYDVYNNESNLTMLLKALEKKWKEDSETRRAIFWVLYRDHSWERKEFNVPLNILNNSTSREVEWWVRDNNVFGNNFFKCIFSHSVYMNKE